MKIYQPNYHDDQTNCDNTSINTQTYDQVTVPAKKIIQRIKAKHNRDY